MVNANGVPTPMPSTCKLSKHASEPFFDASLYRYIVGALQYVTLTRPDITFSVNKVCQFISSRLDAHWLDMKKLERGDDSANRVPMSFSSEQSLRRCDGRGNRGSVLRSFCGVMYSNVSDDDDGCAREVAMQRGDTVLVHVDDEQ
ncbi:hypothetical protein KIW84_024237 [Lathyrus oleraceus]|uniref:Uncharacterized protein n=1 Tax=Pisum sativum TaxID=3888 RepID=A0A9D5BCM2_PEA|nr:hypothetical protein KIW84_024237 [Pisum sativum]